MYKGTEKSWKINRVCYFIPVFIVIACNIFNESRNVCLFFPKIIIACMVRHTNKKKIRKFFSCRGRKNQMNKFSRLRQRNMEIVHKCHPVIRTHCDPVIRHTYTHTQTRSMHTNWFSKAKMGCYLLLFNTCELESLHGNDPLEKKKEDDLDYVWCILNSSTLCITRMELFELTIIAWLCLCSCMQELIFQMHSLILSHNCVSIVNNHRNCALP